MAKKKSANIEAVLKQLVSDVFEKNGNQLLNYKQVSAKLNLNDDESKTTILEILKEGKASGTFLEPSTGKFKIKDLKNFVVGRVDMTADGSAYIVPDDEFEKDVYIGPRKLRNALHGDTVKVYVFAKKNDAKMKAKL